MIDAEIKSVCKDMTTQQMHLPCRFPSPLNYSESVGDGGAGVGALGKKCCDCDWLFFVAICNRDPPTFDISVADVFFQRSAVTTRRSNGSNVLSLSSVAAVSAEVERRIVLSPTWLEVRRVECRARVRSMSNVNISFHFGHRSSVAVVSLVFLRSKIFDSVARKI